MTMVAWSDRNVSVLSLGHGLGEEGYRSLLRPTSQTYQTPDAA